MKVNERRVRELAYQIWESEGRPEGQHDRHWRMARSLAETEAANADGADEAVKPRFEGNSEPEKPALLQEPPRRKGRLPKADPEVPDQGEGETVAPTPSPAERKSPAKAKPTRSAPTVTPTATRKPRPSPAEAAVPSKPAAPRPRTKKQSI
ncbi:DUF2934 domain-containing protein [Pseudomonas sp. LABIM340]|uniref:DUF2934 domain-containing protein n=1 Tax=Pseudomonas nitroreducens TaxID=46680 RepID=A0A5R9A1D3_PSENT|nr:DUF2934 domain-containing protein [Pseudomonas nitroreducens]TLP71606.1 DUF2934 domain-containing protein [Pseudomonas nitroreducens]